MLQRKKTPEENQADDKFFERADAHITLANEHVNSEVKPEIASNSLMYAAARFNIWATAGGFKNGEDMKKEKKAILKFFTEQYNLMLEENFDSYAENYEYFMGVSKDLGENS